MARNLGPEMASLPALLQVASSTQRAIEQYVAPRPLDGVCVRVAMARRTERLATRTSETASISLCVIQRRRGGTCMRMFGNCGGGVSGLSRPRFRHLLLILPFLVPPAAELSNVVETWHERAERAMRQRRGWSQHQTKDLLRLRAKIRQICQRSLSESSVSMRWPFESKLHRKSSTTMRCSAADDGQTRT